MRSAVLVLSLLVLPLALAHAEQAIAGGYSAEPLRQPLLDEAQILVETVALNSWLDSNSQKLGEDQVKAMRERLYYLIDSRVKQIYASERRILPAKHDVVLEILFSWAEPLGVYGGAQAFNAVKAPSTPAQTPGMELPEAVSLGLEGDVFTVRSSAGWSISFPYCFMVWRIADFTATGGPRTQIVALSTGAARDASEAGRSQATLVFLFSREELGPFERYWREQMGVGDVVAPTALGVRDLASRHVVDSTTRLHTEFTAWSDPAGSFAVTYLGIEGTYEWNRPHFVDFLRSISTSSSFRSIDAFDDNAEERTITPALSAESRQILPPK